MTNPDYGFSDDHSGTDPNRVAQATAYAKVQGAFEESGGGSWWLRSPGNYDSYAAYVDCTGSVYDSGDMVPDTTRAVRPALWIKLGN